MKTMQRIWSGLLAFALILGLQAPAQAAENASYTVQMPADTTVAIGSTVRLPVVISHTDRKTAYNAFDIRAAYDPDVLELTSKKLPGATVAAQNGTIHVLGYGADRRAGSVAFTLEFKVLKKAASEVRITDAKVDHSANAVNRDASPAALTDDRTAITAAGGSVTPPDGPQGTDKPTGTPPTTTPPTTTPPTGTPSQGTVPEEAPDLEISVREYVTLDEKSAFLILAKADLRDGGVMTYHGDAMYYSEAYGAWVYLVIADQALDLDQIRAQVKHSAQTNRVTTKSGGDVNGDGRVDVYDVQLIAELYNAEHDSFASVDRIQFLRADVNADQQVDMRDAAWVAWYIREQT